MATDGTDDLNEIFLGLKLLAEKHTPFFWWQAKPEITWQTQVMNDLNITGDDAEEFLEDIATAFNLDTETFFADFDFGDFFPSEASAELHVFELRRWRDRSHNPIVKIVGALLLSYWLQVAKKRHYKPMTLGDLAEAVRRGKWQG